MSILEPPAGSSLRARWAGEARIAALPATSSQSPPMPLTFLAPSASACPTMDG
jgi:hypothetical protein